MTFPSRSVFDLRRRRLKFAISVPRVRIYNVLVLFNVQIFVR